MKLTMHNYFFKKIKNKSRSFFFSLCLFLCLCVSPFFATFSLPLSLDQTLCTYLTKCKVPKPVVNSNPLINGCKIQPVCIVNFESLRYCRTDNLWTCVVHGKMGSHVFISQLVSGVYVYIQVSTYTNAQVFIS